MLVMATSVFSQLRNELISQDFRDDAAAEELLCIRILAAVTGKPWKRTPGSRGEMPSVTWDKHGPGAVGNPVCSFPNMTRSMAETLELIAGNPRARVSLMQRDEDAFWCAEVSVQGLDVKAVGEPSEDLAFTALTAALAFWSQMPPGA
jgi:hypothetical protein